MSDKYLLKDGVPVPVDDLMEWARIAETMVGDVRVSTVFLGMDISFGHGEPVLFETMIFGGVHDKYKERYHTLEESMIGHEKAVSLVKGEAG